MRSTKFHKQSDILCLNFRLKHNKSKGSEPMPKRYQRMTKRNYLSRYLLMPFVIVLLFFAQSQVSGKQLAASKDQLLAGEAKTTVEGIPCQKWSDTQPHRHSFLYQQLLSESRLILNISARIAPFHSVPVWRLSTSRQWSGVRWEQRVHTCFTCERKTSALVYNMQCAWLLRSQHGLNVNIRIHTFSFSMMKKGTIGYGLTSTLKILWRNMPFSLNMHQWQNTTVKFFPTPSPPMDGSAFRGNQTAQG